MPCVPAAHLLPVTGLIPLGRAGSHMESQANLCPVVSKHCSTSLGSEMDFHRYFPSNRSHSDAKSNLGLFYLSSHTSPHSAAAAKSVIPVPQAVDRNCSVQNSRPPSSDATFSSEPCFGGCRRLEARVGRTYTRAHSRGWAVGSGPHWPRHVAWASHNTATGFRGGTSPKQTS